MKDRFILFLVNPISGNGNRKGLNEKIALFSVKNGLNFKITHTPKDSNFGEIKTIIQTNKVTEIVICGGDGSINMCVKSLRHLQIPFGIIPLGSGNALSRTVKIPMNLDKALQRLVNPKIITTDAIQINNQEAFMLFGLGFDAQVAADFEQSKNRGLSNYVKFSLINFFKLNAYPVMISVDGKVSNMSVFMLNIANTNQFGNEFKIAPLASVNDGLLDLVIIPKASFIISISELILQLLLPKLQTKLVENTTKHQYLQAKSIQINNPKKAPLQFDGEIMTCTEKIDITILPKAFKLII